MFASLSLVEVAGILLEIGLRTSDLEKRYQVFISSTKKDLESARSEVSRALLRAKCFPAQMENFNAVDEGQMDHIKRVIDQSDYFVLILGGMYGTINPSEGKSYTQLEYEYALEKSKPVIRLLRKDPFSQLTGDRFEQDSIKRKKLEAFRDEVSVNKLCRFWESEKELGAEVALALTDMKESHPTEGWARASEISSTDARLKIAELNEENRLLREALSNHEAKDFDPILRGLQGQIEVQCFKATGERTASHWPFDSKEAIRVGCGLDKFEYSPAGEVAQLECSQVMKDICFGLLFARDFEGATKKGLLSHHPIGSSESTLLYPVDENALQPSFMALEGAGLIKPGEPYSSAFSFEPERYNAYLRRTPWHLSEDFRRWVVAQNANRGVPKTPPQSAP